MTAVLSLVPVPVIRRLRSLRCMFRAFPPMNDSSTSTSPPQFGAEEIVLDSEPKALQHEPCRLLRDPKSAMNLHTGDTVLAIDQQPESSHPLIESKRRILENGSEFQAELLLALVAEPHAASLYKRVLRLAAAWANNLAIWPAKVIGILKSAVRIGEVNNGFLECIWSFHV